MSGDRWETFYDFKKLNKYSRSARGAVKRPAASESRGHVGGGAYNDGTEKKIECPGCGKTGRVVAWHGRTAHYQCYECETTIRVSG